MSLLYDVPPKTKSERFFYMMCLLRMCHMPTLQQIAVNYKMT